MITNTPLPNSKLIGGVGPKGLGRLVWSVPLFALQPLLKRIVKTLVIRHPDLFIRLGDSCDKRFLINPSNLPFFLLFQPNVLNPKLKAYRRGQEVEYDVYISGTFLTLLRLIDCQTDSDALFFNRDLSVIGPTEAVVALRNALDDMDSTLADDVAASFGPLSRPIRAMIDMGNRLAGEQT